MEQNTTTITSGPQAGAGELAGAPQQRRVIERTPELLDLENAAGMACDKLAFLSHVLCDMANVEAQGISGNVWGGMASIVMEAEDAVRALLAAV